jgi:ankyrin repeat protein
LLHHAAQLGNEEIVRCLVEYQIDPTTKDNNTDKNTLHYAATGNNIEIVKYLL